MVDPELSAALAQAKIDEIQATGADHGRHVVSAVCPDDHDHGQEEKDPRDRHGHHRVYLEEYERIGFKGAQG